MGVVQGLIKDVINDTRPEPIKIEKIISEVAKTYNVSESDILSNRRTAALALARRYAVRPDGIKYPEENVMIG